MVNVGGAIITTVALAVAACGGTGPTAAPTNTSSPQFLDGKGAKWQVVIKADPGAYGVTGLALDGKGHIYLAELYRDQIAEYSLDGSLVQSWGSHGTAAGQMDGPAKITVDGEGNLYVTEIGNNRVQKFSSSGESLAQWGGGPGSAAAGKFNFPVGIAVDILGNAYVADDNNHRVQKLSPTGAPLAEWGSEGPTQLVPYDIALDTKSNVYLAAHWDRSSRRVHFDWYARHTTRRQRKLTREAELRHGPRRRCRWRSIH